MNSLSTSCERKCLQTLLGEGPGRGLFWGWASSFGHCRTLHGRNSAVLHVTPSWFAIALQKNQQNETKNTKNTPTKTNNNNKKSPGIVKYQQIDGIFSLSFFFFFSPSPLVFDCEWLVYIHILISFGNCGTYLKCN